MNSLDLPTRSQAILKMTKRVSEVDISDLSEGTYEVYLSGDILVGKKRLNTIDIVITSFPGSDSLVPFLNEIKSRLGNNIFFSNLGRVPIKIEYFHSETSDRYEKEERNLLQVGEWKNEPESSSEDSFMNLDSILDFNKI